MSEERIDHPAHYGGADDPYEAIKVIEAWRLGFCLGNCLKYVRRAGHKLPSPGAVVHLKPGDHLIIGDGGGAKLELASRYPLDDDHRLLGYVDEFPGKPNHYSLYEIAAEFVARWPWAIKQSLGGWPE